ncbi:MAG: hypothetical protein U5N56_00135 [Candidatus Marinimicrobia bacterium]|nr:hypothetical protein [Candidatus Neomarinimicrobiota bacterium]
MKFPDFLDALKRGKGPVDFEVENALLKKALGHTYEETHTEIRQYKDGSTAKVKKVIEHYTPPDVIACIFWLKEPASGTVEREGGGLTEPRRTWKTR